MSARRVPLLALALAACASAAVHAQASGPVHDPADVSRSPRGARHFEDITGDLPNEPVTAVAVDPRDPEMMYAGLDGFVFKTIDGGESWRPVLSFPRGTVLDDTDTDLADPTAAGAFNSATIAAPVAADDDLDALEIDDELPDGSLDQGDDERGAGDRGLDEARAADGDLDAGLDDDEELPAGDFSDDLDTTTFSRVGPGARAIVVVPGSPDVVYVATPRGLYRSVNRGASFTRLDVPGGVRANDIRDLAVDPSRPSRIYLATAAGLIISRDGAASFEAALGAAGAGAQTGALSVAAGQLTANDGTSGVAVLVGTEAGLLRSTDGGATFLEVLLRGLPPFFPVPAVAISERSETWFAGTSRGLYVGERNAALLERYDGLAASAVQALLTDPARPRAVVLGTLTRGVLFSFDAGLTVDEAAERAPATEITALARPTGKRADDVVVATDRGVFRSRPGTGITVTASALKKLREIWAREPGLDEAARIALKYNGLSSNALANEGLHGMRSRAGLAALLPRAQATFDVIVGRTERREDFVLRAGDELPPGLDPDNDDADLFGNIGAFVVQPSEGVRSLFFVSLVWDLDDVIFNNDEVAVGRALPAWYAAERRVIERVREAWIARRRLMTEIMMGDAPRGQDAVVKEAQRQLRLDELTAQLDGATGGAFSNPAASDDADSQQEDSR